MADVDLVVNCFERSYRGVLAPGFFARIEADNRRSFASRTAIVNNVEDREDARVRAQALVDAGEIDRFVFVAEHIERALAVCGLRAEDLEPFPYFTNFALVAVCLDGPDWFVMWDADATLRAPADWITPAIELMERDPRVLATNPDWPVPNIDEFTFEVDGPFHLGHGFSDHVFLGRRSEFAAPIYGQRCLARLRYPLSALTPIFEARIDAYQRHHGRLRAIHGDVVYEHGVEMATSWPDRSIRLRLADARNQLLIQALRRAPWRPWHLRQL